MYVVFNQSTGPLKLKVHSVLARSITNTEIAIKLTTGIIIKNKVFIF